MRLMRGCAVLLSMLVLSGCTSLGGTPVRTETVSHEPSVVAETVAEALDDLGIEVVDWSERSIRTAYEEYDGRPGGRWHWRGPWLERARYEFRFWETDPGTTHLSMTADVSNRRHERFKWRRRANIRSPRPAEVSDAVFAAVEGLE